MLASLNTSSFYIQLYQILHVQINKEETTTWFDVFDVKFETKKTYAVDDEVEIIKQVSSLFQDFG
jgi:hypothetical protein